MRYDIWNDALVAENLVELGITQSVSPYATPVVTPSDIPTLKLWFKADSLSPSYSQSQVVTHWYNSAPGENYTASQATPSKMPYFTTGSMSGSTAGAKACSVYFDGGDEMDFTQVAAGTKWTLQILFRGNGTDSMLTGIPLTSNQQIRRFRSGANLISIYAEAGGEAISNTFSSSVTQSALCTWNYNSPNITMYEGGNKLDTEGYAGDGQLLSAIGYNRYGWATGHIVELLLWTSSLSDAQLDGLHNGYWRQKYFYEPMFEVTPATQSSTITSPPPTTKTVISNRGNYSEITIKASGQVIENAAISKQMVIGHNGNLTIRSFIETGPPVSSSIESWESYATGQTSGFSDGIGFKSPWATVRRTYLVASESFEQYSDGQSSDFNSGYGFADPYWTIS
jgi:hypothetical protein